MSTENLHQLVENGNLDAIKELVEMDVNLIDAVDDYGRTPLIICSSKKSESHIKIARLLLDFGCDVNIQANHKYNNWTALMTACYFGNFKMIELIMNANPNLELQDIASNTAWQIAFENSYRECVNYILAQMEEKRIEARLELEKELQDAVFNNDVEQVKDCLRKIDPNNLKQVINSTTSGNHTLLYRACRNGNAQIVDLLLQNGAIARPHYYTKYSPLYISCHMGNVEISRIILDKFPHLVQVTTIEKFLPFHAACSQGHLDVLKLLVEYRSSSLNRVYFDSRGNRYLSTFDLNATDVNDQSGLFAAVLANRFEIVQYLLDVKLKLLSDSDCEKMESKIRRSFPSNALIGSKSVPANLGNHSGSSPSFFDHLKSVFLDTKAYDPYVINYTSNPFEKEPIKEEQEHENSEDIENDTDKPELCEYFNPFNINAYSKFGTTCLHEAVRCRNLKMVELLLSKGADANQQVFDFNSGNQQQQSKPISNCLCEAILPKPRDDETLFNLLIKSFKYNEFDFKMTMRILFQQNDFQLVKKYFPHLLRYKITEDGEYKINARNKISHKLLNAYGFTDGNDSPGLVMSWSSLEPKLDKLYESFLSESIKHYKVSNDKSPIDEMNFKKLHIFVVTRLELSSNSLETLPFCLFQMESLKCLKLSNNCIKKLPLSRNPEFDDLSSRSERFSKLPSWSCHSLEELDMEKNQLTELPCCLFQLKSLKHLNISHNKIEQLPVEMWQAPSLFDLNVAHNKLNHLPIIDACSLRECLQGTTDRPRAISNPTERSAGRSRRGDEIHSSRRATKKGIPTSDHPLKSPSPPGDKPTTNRPSINPNQVPNYKLKQVEKVNFWSLHTSSGANISKSGFGFDDLEDIDSTSTTRAGMNSPNQQQQHQNKESKLIELNLSNNQFTKIPECLSCLAPKLIKLNVSGNRIESMGAVCDLPMSLKFLDLSNNQISRSMRLLNENLLRFILFYFTKLNNQPTPSSEDFNLDNILVNLLLENEFCYLNLIKKSLNTQPNTYNEINTHQYQIPISSAETRPIKSRLRDKSSHPSSGDQLNNVRRRTRSQSRNYRAILNSSDNSNDANKRMPSGVGNKRLIPFDLFLINLRYNRAYATANSASQDDPVKNNFEISKLIEEFLTSVESAEVLARQEKLLLNSQNIQIFLEQLCPHKRHIKLENLKSINLSNNRIKKFNFMFDLSKTPEVGIPRSKSSPKVESESEASSSASELSNNESIEDDQHAESAMATSSPKELKESKSRLKNKLAQLSPLKKRSTDDAILKTPNTPATPPQRKKSSSSLAPKTSEERAVIQAKLMFPNLTHLDLSFNRLKSLSSHLAYLENLSYLNASSNSLLFRVSPRLGLLNKLWNFDLRNCPSLREPVMLDSLIKQKTKTSDILGYLKSILEHSRPYTRMKLMFVGVQAIGKTSLLNRLREEGTMSNTKNSWSERTSQNQITSQANMSTVGIDINEWVFERPKPKAQSSNSSGLSSSNTSSNNLSTSPNPYLYIYQQLENSNSVSSTKHFGPITFRTWDFAGQREYYTTHQYFISRRAIYLVCWKLSEEEKGIDEIHQWLSNIQTRAPGSPVIVVGTHQDQLAKLKNYKEISNYLQRLIYERFVRPSAETESTSAYPPIMASIEISSKTGHNIKMLARLIYDVAAQMKTPGLKDQLLLEQKVPVTYLVLEECVYFVLNKLKSQSRNPILNTTNYLKEIREAIEILYPASSDPSEGTPQPDSSSSKLIGYLIVKTMTKSKRMSIRFRDDTEILQASQFLHENGVLIHYNDVALSDIFFLDPQWLCDILATVVTIREINPFAAKGIMKIKDLLVLFKGSRFTESEEIMNFIVDLLGKFELALTWDDHHLLIPSLLPTESMLQFSNQDIPISIISKQKTLADRQTNLSYANMLQQSPISSSISSFFPSQASQQQELASLYSNVKLANSYSQYTLSSKVKMEFLYECRRTNSSYSTESIRRLYCLNYLPSGFFSRLISRILGDKILKDCLTELIQLDLCSNGDELQSLIDFVCQEAQWKCWQTGVELKYLDFTLIRVKEIIFDPLSDHLHQASKRNQPEIFTRHPVLYRDCENEFKCKSISKQCAFVECYASFKSFEIVKNQKNNVGGASSQQPDNNNETKDPLVRILCNRKICIKLYALIIEIIDTLLEDWYPDLGTRFMQDSKGEYLVTRLTPCGACVKNAKTRKKSTSERSEKENDFDVETSDLFRDAFSLNASEHNISSLSNKQASTSSQSSSDPNKSSTSSQLNKEENEKLSAFSGLDWIYCFMLDDLCYSVLRHPRTPTLICPKHGEQVAREIAPDLAFEDIDSSLLISDASTLVFESLLGRGSFGSVFSGSLGPHKVAVKVLENLKQAPITKENSAFISSDVSGEHSGASSSIKSWTYRKSIRLAAKAYTIARQEIAILSSLKNENIVAMIGLSVQPLAIILELAPLGNLKDILSDFKQNTCKLNALVIQSVAIQVSSALLYLHTNRIIYRDLKADNVLVWKFPRPNQQKLSPVYLKLADYSISRCVLPTGTKGFAGTPGFMAPEILKYNGEETYSEKVDCFSFGMLLYELITLKLPFEGQEQLKDIILNGGRPVIRATDLEYPTLALDLMCLCWSDSPAERPSTSKILNYSQSYEFSHLMDVSILDDYDRTGPILIATTINQEDPANAEEEYDESTGLQIDDMLMSKLEIDDDDDEDDEIEEEDLIDVWVVRNSLEEGVSQFEVLTYENRLNCTARKQINVCNERIESLCVYNGNQIWCVDSLKTIFVYCSRTYRKLNQFLINLPDSKPEIVSMYSLENIAQILLCNSFGLLIILKIDSFHALSMRNNKLDDSGANYASIDDLSYYLIDLSVKVNTTILLPSRYDINYDLWLGSENTEIFCFSLKTMRITGSILHTSSHHFLTNSLLNSRSPLSMGCVDLSMSSSSPDMAALSNNSETNSYDVTIIKTTSVDSFFLWTYVYPGSTIYLWNHVSKKIMSSYNCLKAFEDLNFKNSTGSSNREFKIIDMSFLNGNLYCGINSGSVLVLKRLTLTPLLIFQAHVHQLNRLCPLTFETRLTRIERHNSNNIKTGSQSKRINSNSSSVIKRTQYLLLTLGRALAPIHEDIYLSSKKYRIDALSKYANCLILCAWNSVLND